MTLLIHLRRRSAACTTAIVLTLATLGVGASTAAARVDLHNPGSPPPGSTRTAVLEWDAAASRAAETACISPYNNALHEARMHAMASLAIHDALNAIDRRSESYGGWFWAPRNASVDAAVAAAARDGIVAGLRAVTGPFVPCLDAAIAEINRFYAAKLAAIPAGPAKADGLAAGRRAAARILAMRAQDGSDTLLVDADYPEGTAPGEYRFTPGSPFAFAPGWGRVTPFALRNAAQFRAEPPLPLTSARYAQDLREVATYGGDGVTTPTVRTPWQTQVARFWLESSPLMWNTIARTLAVQQHLDPWQQARLLALLNMALADGYTAVLADKYFYDFWRPVTAIRAAGRDGNPATTGDPTWTPLEVTPAIPDHPSGHAVEGGAAAAVFRQFFGTDTMSFSACSVSVTPARTCGTANPIVHHFSSFSQAARQNADSRIWIGFHFRHAAELGTAQGERIGRFTATRLLLLYR